MRWRLVLLLLRHGARAVATRFVACVRLYAVAFPSCARRIEADKVWCGGAPEFPDRIVIVFGPGTQDQTIALLPPLGAVALGQNLIRYGGEMLAAQKAAVKRHARNVGARAGSIPLDRVIIGGRLDS